jgi:hypothetical protein
MLCIADILAVYDTGRRVWYRTVQGGTVFGTVQIQCLVQYCMDWYECSVRLSI